MSPRRPQYSQRRSRSPRRSRRRALPPNPPTRRRRPIADRRPAYVLLEDGAWFPGTAPLAFECTCAEVVFTTNLSGYQEVFTDPSYLGQIVVMTAPMIGNYGINPDDIESDRPRVAGVVVRELSVQPSNWRSTGALAEWLAAPPHPPRAHGGRHPRGRGPGARARRPVPLERAGRSGGRVLCHRHAARTGRRLTPDFRDLPRPPAARFGARRGDGEAPVWASGGEPSGAGSCDRTSTYHLTKPRLRGPGDRKSVV